MEKEFFLLRHVNCGTFNLQTGKMDTDIIGITDDEEYAKSQQSVFCSYEKVRFIENPNQKYVDNCKHYDCAQGRHRCRRTFENKKCTGVCDKFEEKCK